MRNSRIGIIPLSDGREGPHELLLPINKDFFKRTIQGIENLDNIEVIPARKVIHSSKEAFAEAKYMNKQDVDAIILNYSTWTFPTFTAIIGRHVNVPLLLYSNLNPTYPGLVGMLASGGSLDQLDIPHQRVWGDINDEDVINKISRFCRSVKVINELKGQVAGNIGGRSMGMNTTAIDPVDWQKSFGVDVQHVDQLEIVKRADDIESEKVERAFEWLTERVGKINYDNDRLTKDKLKQQIRHYYALKEVIFENKLDFIGLKCHPELSSNHCTQCLSHAFLNDNYDWDGLHEPFVMSCESDMNGALTMQILKLLTGKPVLFMDFRHYDKENNVFVFCNCGSQATYYAQGSDDPEENLAQVQFYPAKVFMKAGGAHVQYVAAPGEVTLARLVRKAGKHLMYIIKGEFKEFPREKCKETSEEWPTAFVEIDAPAEELISQYSSNHIHAVYGNWIEELKLICQHYNIETVVL